MLAATYCTQLYRRPANVSVVTFPDARHTFPSNEWGPMQVTARRSLRDASGGAFRVSMNGKGHIFVVETDDQIRELLERWIGEAGYTVVAVREDVPARVAEPVLVIVNLSRPRIAQALIRSLQAAYAAPILALSARFRRGLDASREAAREMGVRKVLPKPFTRAELLAAIRESLE